MQDRPAATASPHAGEDRSSLRIHSSTPGVIQAKLAVNTPGDAYEQEADRVSERVMRMPQPGPRHACACGGGCPRCQAERRAGDQPLLQTRRGGGAGAGPAAAPASVHQVLNSPAQPLDAAAAGYFEPRFGHDFCDVRVHTGARAAESARQLDARAYTVGRHVVFGGGEYQPHTAGGRRLLAHELTHVVQQSGAAGSPGEARVQRACLPDAECATPQQQARPGSATKFGEEMEAQEAPLRAAKVQQTPQVAQAGGHGLRAVEVEKLFQSELPSLRPLIHSVFVDDTLPPDAAAGRVDCLAWSAASLPAGANRSAFTDAAAGSSCIRVPKKLEVEAGLYNQRPVNQSPKDRAAAHEWLQWYIVRVLTHEVTHVRFNQGNVAFPSYQKCTRSSLTRELGELAAVISEFPVVQGLPLDMRQAWAKAHLTDPRTNPSPTESIFGSIFDVRCSCECGDADALIRAAFDVASAGWSEDKKKGFHAYMKRGEGKQYGVYWPYDASRVGTVGSHEISLAGGLGFDGSSTMSVAMLTYRYVLSNWADGRLKLTTGARFNLASLWEADPRGEYGGVTVGLRYVSTPVSRENVFGGFTARVETGFGMGDFSLTPVEPGGPVSGRRGDWILQVGGGLQFFIPRLTDMVPTSLEAAIGLAEPIGGNARRIGSVHLSANFQF